MGRIIWSLALLYVVAPVSVESTTLLGQAPPYVWQVRPVGGPVTGATAVTVSGENLRNVSSYCRFGSIVVPAVFAAAERSGLTTLACSSPPAVAGNVPVEVSLGDAVSFTANGVLFEYYAPAVGSIFPTSAPVHDAFTLTVTGHLFVGSNYSCAVDDMLFDATLTSPTTLTCAVPPLVDLLGAGPLNRTAQVRLAWPATANATAAAESAGAVAVQSSANATAGGPWAFSRNAADLLLHPALSAAVPGLTRSPSDGGTLLSFDGAGFDMNTSLNGHHVRVGQAVVQARLSFAPPDAANTSNATNGTAAGIPRLTFVTPSAHDAGVTGSRRYLFTSAAEAAQQGVQLVGSAAVSDRVLKLTSRGQLHRRGVAVVRLSAQRLPAMRDFGAEFDCLVGFGSGGAGLSLSYGPGIPEAEFGEQGAGGGLRVLIRTRTAKVIEVVYRQQLVAQAVHTETQIGVWAPVNITVSAAGRVRVCYNLACPLQVMLAGWDPQPAWNVALAARTSERDDHHWVDNLVLRGGALVLLSSQPVELSLNRLNYEPMPFAVDYYAPPVATSVYPRGSDAGGGAVIRVSGHHLHNGTQLRCKFGDAEAVVAEFVPGAATAADSNAAADPAADVTAHWRCVTPPYAGPPIVAGAAELVPVALAINARDFHASGISLAYYRMDNTAPTALAPAAIDAGVPVTVWIEGAFINAPHPMLESTRVVYVEGREQMIETVWDPQAGRLGFTSPTFVGANPQTRDVWLAFNHQQRFLVGRLVFFGPAVLSSLSPLLGPPCGETHITIRGSGFSASNDSVVAATSSCVFAGRAPVQAVVQSDTSLLCVSPSSTAAGLVTRAVAVANPNYHPSRPTAAVGVHTENRFVTYAQTTVAFNEDFAAAFESRWHVETGWDNEGLGGADWLSGWNYSAYTAVDEATGGLPGNNTTTVVLGATQVVPTLAQTSEAFAGPMGRAMGINAVLTDGKLGEGYVECELLLQTAGVATVMVKYVDPHTHYAFEVLPAGNVDGATAFRRLRRVENGVSTIVAADTNATNPAQLFEWYTVRIVMFNSSVAVWWDDALLLEAADTLPVGGATTVAVGAWSLPGLHVRRLQIVPPEVTGAEGVAAGNNLTVELLGTAGWLSNDTLTLTRANSTGEQVATIVVASDALAAAGPLEVAMDLRMGNGCDGLSVSYGEVHVPTAPGPADGGLATFAGTGDGVRVRLGADGSLWAGYGVSQQTAAHRTGAFGPGALQQWTAVRVRLARLEAVDAVVDGAPAVSERFSLTVSIAGDEVLSGPVVLSGGDGDGVRRVYRLVLGSSARHTADGGLAIRRMSVSSGTAVDAVGAAVQVTLNGRDLLPFNGTSTAHLPFVFATPTIRSVDPVSLAKSATSTLLTLLVAHVPLPDATVDGVGYVYQCVVISGGLPVSYSAAQLQDPACVGVHTCYVTCTVPDVSVMGDAAHGYHQIALNASRDGASVLTAGVPIAVYDPILVDSYPIAVTNGSVLTLYGSNFESGTDVRCRFADADGNDPSAFESAALVVQPSFLDPDAGPTLKCTVPAALPTDTWAQADVSVTLNGGADGAYSDPLPLGVFAPSIISHFYPTSVHGTTGTNVTLYGAFDGPGVQQTVMCRMGSTTRAAIETEPGQIVCPAPAFAEAADVLVAWELAYLGNTSAIGSAAPAPAPADATLSVPEYYTEVTLGDDGALVLLTDDLMDVAHVTAWNVSVDVAAEAEVHVHRSLSVTLGRRSETGHLTLTGHAYQTCVGTPLGSLDIPLDGFCRMGPRGGYHRALPSGNGSGAVRHWTCSDSGCTPAQCDVVEVQCNGTAVICTQSASALASLQARTSLNTSDVLSMGRQCNLASDVAVETPFEHPTALRASTSDDITLTVAETGDGLHQVQLAAAGVQQCSRIVSTSPLPNATVRSQWQTISFAVDAGGHVSVSAAGLPIFGNGSAECVLAVPSPFATVHDPALGRQGPGLLALAGSGLRLTHATASFDRDGVDSLPVAVAVSLNHHDYTPANATALLVRTDPNVTSVEPSCGYAGTTLRLYGTALQHGTDFMCIFRLDAQGVEVSVTAAWNATRLPRLTAGGPGAIVCEVPSQIDSSHAGSTFDVVVRINGQEDLNAVPFTVLAAPDPINVFPHSGPITGLTDVVIDGSAPFDANACRVLCGVGQTVDGRVGPVATDGGGVVVQGELIDGQIHCQLGANSTGLLVADPYHVRVSLNGQDFSDSTAAAVLFSYFGTPEIRSITPRQGLYDEVNTLSIAAHADGFQYGTAGEYRCTFSFSDANLTVATVAAVYTADALGSGTGAVQCDGTLSIIPDETVQSMLDGNPELVAVRVSLNEQQFYPEPDGAFPTEYFVFYNGATVPLSVPDDGPTTGGTVVVVPATGQSFTSYNASALCRFGTVSVPASLAPGQIICVSPPSGTGLQGAVMLQISLFPQNDEWFNGQNFVYYDNPIITGITTIAVASGAASGTTGTATQVFINGSNVDVAPNQTVCVWTWPTGWNASAAANASSSTAVVARRSDGVTTPMHVLGDDSIHDASCSAPTLGTAMLGDGAWAGAACEFEETAGAGLCSTFFNVSTGGVAAASVGRLGLVDTAGLGGGSSGWIALQPAEVFPAVDELRVQFDTFVSGDSQWESTLVFSLGPPTTSAGAGAQQPSQSQPSGGEGLHVVWHTFPGETLADMAVAFGDDVWVSAGRVDGARLRAGAWVRIEVVASLSNGTARVVVDGREVLSRQSAAGGGAVVAQKDWELSLVGTNAGPGMQLLDNLRLTSPQWHSQLPVALHLEAYQNYISAAVTFHYFADLYVHDYFPKSGPHTGETVVVLRCDQVSDLWQRSICSFRFSDGSVVNVTATADTSASTVECVTPPAVGSAALGEADVVVVLNDQQITAVGTFVYYDTDSTAALQAVVPRSGPTGGGSNLTITLAEAALDAGGLRELIQADRSVVYCVFGNHTSVAAFANPLLTCRSPPSGPGVGVSAFAVSFNGNVVANDMHFSGSFTFYDDPAVSAVTPGTVAFDGGDADRLVLHSPAGGFALGTDIICRIGLVDDNATFINDTHITCPVRGATAVGAASSQRFAVDDQALLAAGGGASLHHSAAVNATLGGLALTPVLPDTQGSIVVRPAAGVAFESLRVAFEVTVTGSLTVATDDTGLDRVGSNGFSVSFGEMDDGNAHIGEGGVGLGLRATFLTLTNKHIEVLVDGDVVRRLYVGEHCQEQFQPDRQRGLWTFDDCTPFNAIRNGTANRVVLEWIDGSVSLSLADLIVADRVPIHMPVPPAADWAVVIGARTGGEADSHVVDQLQVDAGAAINEQTARIELSLNNQHFYDVGIPLVYNANV